MSEYLKSESDGWFYVTTKPGLASRIDRGDLGSGASETITRFQSAEAREYYIRAEKERERADAATYFREWLIESLRGCITPKGRIRRKRLIALIAGLHEGKEG